MKLALSYLTPGLICLSAPLWLPETATSLVLAWVGLSLTLVGGAYWLRLPRLFRKRANGAIPWYVMLLLAPYMAGAHVYNALARRNDGVPSLQEIDDRLYLGNRLFLTDMEELNQCRIRAILDLTAEFNAPDWSRSGCGVEYLNIPVLDHSFPTRAQCVQAVSWIRCQIDEGRTVAVCCALGRGRSVFVALAYLLSRFRDSGLEETVRRVRSVRKTVRLNSRQRRTLKAYMGDGPLAHDRRAWVIANPSSGGGKWELHRETVVQLLASGMELTVRETAPDATTADLARAALADGADCVVVCGGDGTLNEAADVLTGTDTPLGVVPLGTGNSFIHALHGVMAKINSVESACAAILGGRTRRVDTARCNDRLVLLLVGVGFEQGMIEKADRARKARYGKMAYVTSLWETVCQNAPIDICLTLDDGEPVDMTVSSLVTANAAPVTTLLAQGGGEPDMTDGQLDLTWIDPLETSGMHILGMVELLAAGLSQETTDFSVHHASARRVRLTANAPLRYVIDGEVFEDSALDIRIDPASLTVAVP